MMNPKRRTLAIESSCDETAVAILDGEGRVEVNLLSSQIRAHSPYGGVVPELASREHLKALAPMVEEALAAAGGPPELVAVTTGPGLIGALLVGVRFAAAFAWGRRLPLVAVDHLDGHQVSPFLNLDGDAARRLPERALSLVASGGHSSWYLFGRHGSERLCRTRDDAAGESFDKVAKVLGLAYPGGPEVDRLARQGVADAVPLPRPRLKDNPNDFSFSGLKSATIRWIHSHKLDGVGHSGGQAVNDLLASFEATVVDLLLAPLRELVHTHDPLLLTASGGVAANTRLRQRLLDEGEALDLEVLLPPPALTTDNAAMIARAGQLAFERGCGQDPRQLDAWASEKWQPPGMRRVLGLSTEEVERR